MLPELVAGIAGTGVPHAPVVFVGALVGIVIGKPDGPLQMVVVLPSGSLSVHPCVPAWSPVVAFDAPEFWILGS